VKLGRGEKIPSLDHLAVGSHEAGDATVSRISRERVEASVTDVATDLFQIPARPAAGARAQGDDELIDIREHAAAQAT
jgi:hypothetical protein